jgi:hypothetical protein
MKNLDLDPGQIVCGSTTLLFHVPVCKIPGAVSTFVLPPQLLPYSLGGGGLNLMLSRGFVTPLPSPPPRKLEKTLKSTPACLLGLHTRLEVTGGILGTSQRYL